ncbi:hypothetical protein SPRG_10201 [Saprolegnia parasitica CBS 223.65]|uniref:B30.2/SPRY domain-containing protein n=1 Tax=Saprolegnia parasitica (strain CBS 223.65) TaxID=695850 RepID=A0A067C2E7_SAPPC|nr:hypothetical protein SPRG_10201 [Saprolegnia parasitica CBS 223.65]KDO24668.1 hypothetical protein SPRG_10201 [Saprolegnia parasitica CBS 223.65]|eukprot:XP_012204549.1 hypothetical protein SPRG_10201 [Saprolegnia parasitica CBS 223.65]
MAPTDDRAPRGTKRTRHATSSFEERLAQLEKRSRAMDVRLQRVEHMWLDGAEVPLFDRLPLQLRFVLTDHMTLDVPTSMLRKFPNCDLYEAILSEPFSIAPDGAAVVHLSNNTPHRIYVRAINVLLYHVLNLRSVNSREARWVCDKLATWDVPAAYMRTKGSATWSQRLSSRRFNVSADKRTLISTPPQDDAFEYAVVVRPTDHVAMRLVKVEGSIALGFTRCPTQQQSSYDGWFVHIARGPHSVSFGPTGCYLTCLHGDMLTLVLDRREKTIRVYRNQQDLGVAYVLNSTEKLKVAPVLAYRGCPSDMVHFPCHVSLYS